MKCDSHQLYMFRIHFMICFVRSLIMFSLDVQIGCEVPQISFNSTSQ